MHKQTLSLIEKYCERVKTLEITQMKPDKGKKDAPVTLIGYDFGVDKDIVFFGDVKLHGDLIKSWNSSTIEFNVPIDGVGKYDVIVKVGSSTSKPKKFEVTK